MSYPFFTGKPVSLKDPIDNTDSRSSNNTTNNSEFTPMSNLRNNADNVSTKSDTPTNTSTTTGTNNNNSSSNNNASGNFPYQSLHFHNPSNTSTKSNVSPTNSTPVSRTKSQKARLENVHYQNFLSDWKRSQPDNCCVCLDSLPGVNNDLVFCAHPECDVCVHQECYGILEVPSANELWYCDKCQHPDREKLCCKLCPQKGGALKPIRDMSCWVHVVCALWWPQVQINDDRGILEIVNVDNIPREAYQRVCYLCDNAQDSHYGASVICQAPKCNKTVHITCAQRWDLLEECTDMAQLAADQEPYYIYCKDHGFRDTPKVNPWAEWAYKKTVYYENMCKNEMEYAPSVNTTETSFNPPSLPRRHSIQFNGIMLPPISSITPLEPVAETGTTPDLKNESFPSPNLSTFTELPGFVKNITTLYNLYEQDRSEFIQHCDQIKNTNHTHIQSCFKPTL
ncbi:hypothetical protein CONCODRAFT_92498 [Conidiobolus coronatus NRRL 28638]|uniref:PHD-type domain-containing protein n=1 Tax=Conidiobolus coronatus (strain ATCC 28846 / CBS 209.66 / NRRL 28638) TaxID=796925 RepID=A0A137P3T1_CONC2|nr:hypothetical protein CONCODRAFT_92498 [Conidiobolus coronatus NRRL 28638]|eukprot:KXN69682.1 hypothetical protein CONCODRAFT_92498 [Conidiobolus coronatus NRRL 28638]